MSWKYTAKYLEELTHHEAPWKIARGELPPDEQTSAILSKKSMQDFYTKMQQQINAETH